MSVGIAVLIGTAVRTNTADAAIERSIREGRTDPTGLLNVEPNRIELDVEPGVQATAAIRLFNDNPDETIDVTLEASDYGATADPKNIGEDVEDGEFGAGDWITFDASELRMEPYEDIELLAYITPPTDAPVGTNLAAIKVRGTVADGDVGASDQQDVIQVEGLIQTFLTVPGPVEYDLRITDIDTRSTFLIGDNKFAVYDITFANGGTVNEHVSGSVHIRSIFGNTADRIEIDDLIVLRGAKRTTRVVWRDVPWAGVFTPELRVRGDNAKLVTQQGEPLVVFPMWLPVLIGAAVLLPPLFIWWRRRQEWKQYLDEDLDEEDWDDPDLVQGH